VNNALFDLKKCNIGAKYPNVYAGFTIYLDT
jgi:hypothetical protein